LVLFPQILGMAGVGGGVLALEAALVLELGFPLNLSLGLATGISPYLCPSIPWSKCSRTCPACKLAPFP
jgi:hypothetical protein